MRYRRERARGAPRADSSAATARPRPGCRRRWPQGAVHRERALGAGGCGRRGAAAQRSPPIHQGCGRVHQEHDRRGGRGCRAARSRTARSRAGATSQITESRRSGRAKGRVQEDERVVVPGRCAGEEHPAGAQSASGRGRERWASSCGGWEAGGWTRWASVQGHSYADAPTPSGRSRAGTGGRGRARRSERYPEDAELVGRPPGDANPATGTAAPARQQRRAEGARPPDTPPLAASWSPRTPNSWRAASALRPSSALSASSARPRSPARDRSRRASRARP